MTRVRGGSPFFGGPGGPIHVRIGVGAGPFGALAVLLLFVVIVAVLALLVTLVIRRSRFAHQFAGGPRPPFRTSQSSTNAEALRILNDRFARGEIDADDYRERRDILRGDS